MKTKIAFFLFCSLIFCSLRPTNAQLVALDPTFGKNGIAIIPTTGKINRLIFDKSENIIVIGNTTENGFPAIIKTDSNGILDNNFGINGKVILEYEKAYLYDFKITEDNKIFLMGQFNSQVFMIQFNEDGSFDDSYGINGKIIVTSSLGLLSVNIKDVFSLTGEFMHGYAYNYCFLSKYNFKGEKDENFGHFEEVWLTDNNVTYNIFSTCIEVLNDKSILVGGYDYPSQNHIYTKEPNAKIAFCKLDQDGQFITNFADNGRFITDIVFDKTEGIDEAILDVLEDNNGNLVFTGFCENNCFIFRALPNGTVDNTFGNNGFCFLNIQYPLTNIEQPGRNILSINDKYLTGWYNRIICTNSNGNLDTNFNNTGVFNFENFTFLDMKFQKNNKLILGGSFDENFSIARLNIPLEVSAKSYEMDNTIHFFPNPSKNILYFSKEKQYEIMDIQGRLLLKSEKPMQTVNVAHLKTGIYFIEFDDSQVVKFVKE
jgi:uncharacterized delta-60 repeat protein